MKLDPDFLLDAFLWASIPLLLLIMLATRSALAFPEMSRFGYANCATCHVSPSGGGILTPYGRVQSEELLALWKTQGEPVESPISLGAQLRVLQLQSDTAKAFRRAFLLMQADVEGAATVGPVAIAGTLGADSNGRPFSRRHYVKFQPLPYISVRVGKLLPFFGLGLAEHNLAIRENFGPGSERYSIETGVTYERGSTFLTYSKGEGILRQAVNLGDSQVGVGVRVAGEVFEGGAFALWKISHHFFCVAEAIYSERAHRGYARLQYQPINGVGFYAHRQEFKDRFSGVGFHFIPFSGLETKTEINKTDGGYFGMVMASFWM